MPVMTAVGGEFQPLVRTRTLPDGSRWTVEGYRPRVEGLFARIERWTRQDGADVHWRSISRDDVTTLYGTTAESRIADPADPRRVLSWLICESYDDRGNAIVYRYAAEGSDGVDLAASHERNRTDRDPVRRALPQARPVRQPDAARGRRGPARSDGLAVRGSPRLRRARRQAARPARLWRAGVPKRPVLNVSRRLRGAPLPPLPARAAVPSLPRRAGGRRRLPGVLDRPDVRARSGCHAPGRDHPVRLPAPGGRLPAARIPAAGARVLRRSPRRPAPAHRGSEPGGRRPRAMARPRRRGARRDAALGGGRVAVQAQPRA